LLPVIFASDKIKVHARKRTKICSPPNLTPEDIKQLGPHH
jgi:hypothetical protein